MVMNLNRFDRPVFNRDRSLKTWPFQIRLHILKVY